MYGALKTPEEIQQIAPRVLHPSKITFADVIDAKVVLGYGAWLEYAWMIEWLESIC